MRQRQNLIQKRKEHKMKQEEVAIFLEITTRHYRQLEAGTSNGSIGIWQQLAKKFDTTIDYLLEQIDDAQNPPTPIEGEHRLKAL